MIPLWIIFALATAILWATYALLSRSLAKESPSPLAFAVIFGIWASAVSFIPALWEPWTFTDVTVLVLWVTFLATVFFGLYQGLEFFARKHLEASRSTIFFQLAPVISFIGGALFLSEPFTLMKVGAVALIVGGNIVALYKHGGAVSAKGALYMLGVVIGLGMGYVADKFVIGHYPIALYSAISYFFPSLYCLAILAFQKGWIAELKNESVRLGWKLPILALVGTAGYYFALKTFLIADVSVAVPVIFTSTIFTALGGILILGERGSIPQKILGALIVFSGVVLLQLS